MTKKLEKVLDELHTELAETLLIELEVVKQKLDLNVARQFLKIMVLKYLPADNTPLKELVDELPFRI